MVYQTGAAMGRSPPTWFDLEGNKLGTLGEPARLQNIYLSPDGKRALAEVSDSQGHVDLWMYDVARSTASRFTFDTRSSDTPVWSPDGRQVVYGDEAGQLWLKPADGSSEAQQTTAPTAGPPPGRPTVACSSTRPRPAAAGNSGSCP